MSVIHNTTIPKIVEYIKQELIKEYQEQVYSYVGRNIYYRRGSLLQADNYRAEEKVLGNLIQLSIDSIVHPSTSMLSPFLFPIDDNAYLVDWIENGDITNPWNDKRDYPWLAPRKVFEYVSDKIENDKTIQKMLQEDIIAALSKK